MSSTITTAAREYASRPADERFTSVDAMITAAQTERDASKEVTYNIKDLKFTPADQTINVESPKGIARFTHWAFGQACRMLEAPAAFLRDKITPELAADVLNYRIKESQHGESTTMLVKAPNGNPFPMVRAWTGETYARIWDSALYGQIKREIMQDDTWTTPPTWSGEPAGAYRGDRDSFLIVTNGGSIVNNPSAAQGSGNTGSGGRPMYRGLLVRNSEVGASSITIEQILFDYICGNHMLWGAVVDKRYRRRHIGTKVSRDTITEIARIAHAWTRQSTERDNAIIRGLIDHEIAHTKEAVIDELQAIGFSKADAIAAYDTCERTETASPRSFWGIAEGATRMSQESGYQDTRYILDQLAAKVLAKGRKLVAA